MVRTPPDPAPAGAPSDKPGRPEPAVRSSSRHTARTRRVIALGPLQDRLGYFIRRAQVSIFQDFIRSLSAIDIRPAQYSVLVVIGANPGLSQSDLADTLGIERARLVRLLDRLEKRGLTKRLPAPQDRRSHALQLTAEGQKLLKRANTLSEQHEARMVGKFGEETYRTLIEQLREFAR